MYTNQSLIRPNGAGSHFFRSNNNVMEVTGEGIVSIEPGQLQLSAAVELQFSYL